MSPANASPNVFTLRGEDSRREGPCRRQEPEQYRIQKHNTGLTKTLLRGWVAFVFYSIVVASCPSGGNTEAGRSGTVKEDGAQRPHSRVHRMFGAGSGHPRGELQRVLCDAGGRRIGSARLLCQADMSLFGLEFTLPGLLHGNAMFSVRAQLLFGDAYFITGRFYHRLRCTSLIPRLKNPVDNSSVAQ